MDSSALSKDSLIERMEDREEKRERRGHGKNTQLGLLKRFQLRVRTEHAFHGGDVLGIFEPGENIQVVLRLDQCPTDFKRISLLFCPSPFSLSFESSSALCPHDLVTRRRIKPKNVLCLFDLLRRGPVREDGDDEGPRFGKAHGVHVLELAELEVRGGFFVAADLFAGSRGGRAAGHGRWGDVCL